jgi:hypothetical protein
MWRVLFAAVFASLVTAAFGMDGQLVGQGGASTVIIWKDKTSHEEGLSLISAGVHKTNPALLVRLISCIVPSGTRAITTSAGFMTHDIMVVEGEHSGCRGNVPMEVFKSR